MTEFKNNKFIIFGSEGYLGSHFYQYLKNKDPDTLGTSKSSRSDRLFFDLNHPSLDFLESIPTQFTHALICAAIPNLIKCQQEPTKTFQINVLETLNLVKMLHQRNIFPILFSSDVVFDGSLEVYTDESPTSPLNEYGKQKALLEALLPKISSQPYLILRLTKTYSINNKDRTLLHELIHRLIKREPIQAAYDLSFNPIFIDDVLEATWLLIQKGCSGLYNLCSEKATTWLDLAKHLAKNLALPNDHIQAISIDDLPSHVPRAKNLPLKAKKFSEQFHSFHFLSIDEAISKISENYKNNPSYQEPTWNHSPLS